MWWPQVNPYITRFLDKPCLDNITAEQFDDAYLACTKRMEAGSRAATYFTGMLLLNGQGVKRDLEQSEILFKQLIGTPDRIGALAYHGLGDVYKTQESPKRNYSLAASYYKSAADMDLDMSQFQYGLIRYIGRGVKQNKNEAERYIKMAAKNGNKLAQEILPALSNEDLPNLIKAHLSKCNGSKC